jgi:hypothetical protein
LQESVTAPQFTQRIHDADENPSFGGWDFLSTATQAVNPSSEVLLALCVVDAMVPKTATPTSASMYLNGIVLLLLSERVGQEVLKASVEELDDPITR